MPSKSKAQARLMRAVAHGWHPDKGTGPPKSVAREYMKADSLRSRYRERKAKLNKWAHGDAKSNVGEYRT